MSSVLTINRALGSALQNGVLMSGLIWIETAFSVAYFIIIVQVIGPEGYGLWNYGVTAYAMAISLIALGFESVVIYAYGGTAKDGNRVTQAALFLRLVLAFGALPVFATLALVGETDVSIRTALLLVAPAITGRSIALFVRSIFVARENVQRYFRYGIAFRVIEVLVGSMMLISGFSILAILALHTALWCLEAIWALRSVMRSYGLRICLPDLATTKFVLRTGAPRAALTAFSAWMLSAPILLFERFGGNLAMLGQLAVALQLITLIMRSLDAFLQANAPRLSRAEKTSGASNSRYGPFVAFGSAFLFGAIWLFLYLVGTPLITLVFGDEYVLASQLAMSATLLGALQVIPQGYVQVMLARNIHWPAVAASFVGCIVITAGFFQVGEGLDPATAIVIACVAWGVRAVILYGCVVISRSF